jgi:hypothetical protein
VTPELQLRLAGALQIALAALHVVFPKRFNWKEDLARLSLLNRQMFVVHTVFICVVLVLVGSLSQLAPHRCSTRRRSRASSWRHRRVLGAAHSSCSSSSTMAVLWRGDRFNTVVHVAFCMLWAYLLAVYAGVLLLQA